MTKSGDVTVCHIRIMNLFKGREVAPDTFIYFNIMENLSRAHLSPLYISQYAFFLMALTKRMRVCVKHFSTYLASSSLCV